MEKTKRKMRLRNINLSALLLILILFSGCKKDEAISNTPSIKFISIAPNPAVKYVDPIRIVIEYTDGDGDLGENTADAKNLFVTDNRNNVTYEFRMPQLAPDNSKIIIKGEQPFNLSAQGFVDDTHTQEDVVYSIYVVDRAGNKSNTVQTSTLTIKQ